VHGLDDSDDESDVVVAVRNNIGRKKSVHAFKTAFDGQGVLTYIGSQSSRSKEYENPHSSGEVTASMSTVATGSNLHIVVEQVNAILPNHTRDEPESWVMVDFGENRKLLPDRYCLLHGAVDGKNAIRNWEIQAKIGDGDEWAVLRAYQRNKKLKVGCHSTASWKLKSRSSNPFKAMLHPYRKHWGAGRKTGFRYIRLFQTGPNSSGSNGLYVGGWEFYGTLTEKFD